MKSNFFLILLLTGLLACNSSQELESTDTAAAPLAEGSGPAPAESENRGKAEIQISGKTISIDYGRPELRGRDMLAQAEEGMVWRLGMNEATTLTTDGALVFGETVLAPGTYTLFAKHVRAGQWTLVLNSETGLWGAFNHDPSKDVAEIPLQLKTLDQTVEKLTITLEGSGTHQGRLAVRWGTHELATEFTVR